MKLSVRFIYLYLFSFVGLLTVVIGSVRMVDLGLKVFVFREADRYEYMAPKIEGEEITPAEEQQLKEQASREQTKNRQREFSGAFAMIAIGLPLYLYHWKTIQKEHKKS